MLVYLVHDVGRPDKIDAIFKSQSDANARNTTVHNGQKVVSPIELEEYKTVTYQEVSPVP